MRKCNATIDRSIKRGAPAEQLTLSSALGRL